LARGCEQMGDLLLTIDLQKIDWKSRTGFHE
jgi:hypothetical protein